MNKHKIIFFLLFLTTILIATTPLVLAQVTISVSGSTVTVSIDWAHYGAIDGYVADIYVDNSYYTSISYPSSSTSFDLSAGSHTITVYVYDDAGNQIDSYTQTVDISGSSGSFFGISWGYTSDGLYFWIKVAGLGTLYIPTLKWWQGFFANIWNAIIAPFTAIWNSLAWAIGELQKAVQNGINAIVGAISGFFNFIAQKLEEFKNALINAWNGLVGFFSGLVSGFINAISNAITTVWNAIAGLFNAIWNAIAGFFSTIWNIFASIANAIIPAFESLGLEHTTASYIAYMLIALACIIILYALVRDIL